MKTPATRTGARLARAIANPPSSLRQPSLACRSASLSQPKLVGVVAYESHDVQGGVSWHFHERGDPVGGGKDDNGTDDEESSTKA